MAKLAVLLRGVNVGKDNSLPMAELRSMLQAIGCTEVQTHLQSGNAIVETRLKASQLAGALEAPLERAMGRPIATTVRTLSQLRKIIAENPFADIAHEPKNLCVSFLTTKVKPAEIAPLTERDWMPERYEAAGKEIYTWHPNGQGRSPLAAALVKLPVKGTLTTRNWNTVLKLVDLMES